MFYFYIQPVAGNISVSGCHIGHSGLLNTWGATLIKSAQWASFAVSKKTWFLVSGSKIFLDYCVIII